MTAPTMARARPGTIWHNGRGEGWVAGCCHCTYFIGRHTERDAWIHRVPLGGRACPR